MPANNNDPLDLTVRALLERVLAAQAQADTEWVNLRGDQWPWRQIVAAAERGECSVSRVGRKLMMRREELDAWLMRQRIPARANKSPGEDPGAGGDGDDKHVAQLLEDAGYKRRRR